MDKKELIIFALFMIIAVFVIVQTVKQPEQVIIEKPISIILPAEPITPEVPEEPVVEEPPVVAPPVYQPPPEPPKPAKWELTPAYTEFYVNRIFVPPFFPTFIPIMDDDIKTFSGKFGPYYEDIRSYITVELCAHARDYPEMFACEKVWELNFIDNYVTFVRGYPPDEYVGNVALKNYGAYYVVKSKDYGNIAQSSVAPIRQVKD